MMASVISFLLCALQATAVLSANLTVPVGSGTLSAAVAGAAPGDTLVLQSGTYWESGIITITKPLNIIGQADNTTVIAVDAQRVPYVLAVESDAAQWNVSLAQIFILDTHTGGKCNVTEPHALKVAAPMDVYNATLLAGFVNIEADMGRWANTRKMQEVRVGTCPYRTVDRNTLQGMVLSLHTATCHGRLAFRLAFDRLRTCGAAVDKTNPQFVAYKVAMDATWAETVTYDANGKRLLQTAYREATAATIMRIQLDRVGQVNATISVVHATPYQIQAVITAVTRQDDNTTDIDVALLLPFPFSIPVPAGGSVDAVKTLVPVSGLTNWTMTSSACDRTPLHGACGQSLRFSMEGCQITGQYMLNGFWTQCQLHDDTGSPLNPDYCPPLPTETIGISLHIDAKDFCTSRSNVLGLFQASVNLWADANFTQKRTNTEFKLGQPVYASVDIKPGDSGILVQNGQIVDMVRSNADSVTSSSNDTACPTTTTNGTNLTQGFVASAPAAGSNETSQIQTAIGLTTSVACAAPASRHLSNTATVYTEKDEQGYFQTITLGSLPIFSSIINQTKSVTVCVAVAEIYALPDYAGPSYVLTSLTGCTTYNLDVAPALMSASSSSSNLPSVLVDGSRVLDQCWSSGPSAYPTVSMELGTYYKVDHVMIYGPEADGLKVFVDGQECDVATGWPTIENGGVAVECPGDVIGRQVKLIAFSQNTDLSLCEVEVWGQKMSNYVPPVGVPTDISIPMEGEAPTAADTNTNTQTDTATSTNTENPTMPSSAKTGTTNTETVTQGTTNENTVDEPLSEETGTNANEDVANEPLFAETGTNANEDAANEPLFEETGTNANEDAANEPLFEETGTNTNENAANEPLSGETGTNTNTTTRRRRAAVVAGSRGKSSTGLAKNGKVVSVIQFEFKIQVDYVDRKGAARRRRNIFTARAAQSDSALAQSPPLFVAYDNVEFNSQRKWEAVDQGLIRSDAQDDGLVLVAAGVSGVLLFLGCGMCTGILVTLYVRLGRLRTKVALGARSTNYSMAGGLAQSFADVKGHAQSHDSSTVKLLPSNGGRRGSDDSHTSVSSYRNSISMASGVSDVSSHVALATRMGNDRMMGGYSNSILADARIQSNNAVGRKPSMVSLAGIPTM